MKIYLQATALVMMIAMTGCTAAVIAGGATGGYAVATDERSVDRMVDDSTITSRINTDMMNDSKVKARQIDVDTVGGNVTLTGVVGTREEAERAVAIAERAPGVKSVKNNLQIGEKSWTEFFNDKVIGSKIKSRLIVEPEIRSLNIDVDVHRGVVTLTGMVDTGNQKNRAIEIARSTEGTLRVVDNLKVYK
ncbi:MAG: BON domain-containing protein [Desulfobacteraceae bacterium]|jgi:hyperosmotically inducible protein